MIADVCRFGSSRWGLRIAAERAVSDLAWPEAQMIMSDVKQEDQSSLDVCVCCLLAFLMPCQYSFEGKPPQHSLLLLLNSPSSVRMFVCDLATWLQHRDANGGDARDNEKEELPPEALAALKEYHELK